MPRKYPICNDSALSLLKRAKAGSTVSFCCGEYTPQEAKKPPQVEPQYTETIEVMDANKDEGHAGGPLYTITGSLEDGSSATVQIYDRYGSAYLTIH